MAKKLTSKKAREILHDKEVHGHPLTDKQRRFFGAIAGGAKPYKAQIGTMLMSPPSVDMMDRISDVLSFPQKAITKLITGKYQTPSEAMKIKNPWGAMATDMLLDPLTLVAGGAGASKVGKIGKAEELINLYRIQEKGAKTFAQLAAEGKIPKVFNNPETIARKAAEEKYFGQWFTKDKADLDWYSRDREFTNPEIIELQVPKSKLSQYQTYDRSLSRAPEREFVIPHNEQKAYLKKKQDGGWMDKYADGGELTGPKDKPVALDDTEIFEHGEDMNTAMGLENGIGPSALTEDGARYAALVGQHAAKTGKKRLVSSDIERAMQTAAVAQQAGNQFLGKNKLTHEVDPILETWNTGVFEGTPKGTFQEPEWVNNPDAIPEGGESFNQFKDRMVEAYHKVKEAPKDEQVIAHSKVTRAFRALNKTGEKWTDKTTKLFLKDTEKGTDTAKDGTAILKQKGKDNYDKQGNYNDYSTSVPPGFVGMGNNLKGRNYSPAWGGQFQNGGNLMPPMAGAFQPLALLQMGGSLPGATGMMYARTVNPAPSNGPYAKKTKASAQNGQEMKYYQEGLDFKPKTISQNGNEISTAQGGKRVPITVSDPNDPRLRAYRDSLIAYNHFKSYYDKAVNTGIVPDGRGKNIPVFSAANRQYLTRKQAIDSDYDRYVNKLGLKVTRKDIENEYKKIDVVPGQVKDEAVGYYTFQHKNDPGHFRLAEYKKPVQPVVYKKPQNVGKKLVMKLERDLGYDLPTPHEPTLPELNVYNPDAPTKYAFTYPTFDKDVHKTKYFPSREALKSFIKDVKGATYQEGKDYATATGTLKNGGWLDKYEDGDPVKPLKIIPRATGDLRGPKIDPKFAENVSAAQALAAQQNEPQHKEEFIGPAAPRTAEHEAYRRRKLAEVAATNPEVQLTDSGELTQSPYGQFIQSHGKNLDRLAGGIAGAVDWAISTPSRLIQSTYKPNYTAKEALLGKPSNAGFVEDVITDPTNLIGTGLFKGSIKTLLPRMGEMLLPKLATAAKLSTALPFYKIARTAEEANPIIKRGFEESIDRLKNLVEHPAVKQSFKDLGEKLAIPRVVSADPMYAQAITDPNLPLEAIDELAKSFTTADPAQLALTKPQIKYVKELGNVSTDLRNISQLGTNPSDIANFITERSGNVSPRDLVPFIHELPVSNNKKLEFIERLYGSRQGTGVDNPIARYTAAQDLFGLVENFQNLPNILNTGFTPGNTYVGDQVRDAIQNLIEKGTQLQPIVNINDQYFLQQTGNALDRSNVKDIFYSLFRQSPTMGIPTAAEREAAVKNVARQVSQRTREIFTPPVRSSYPQGYMGDMIYERALDDFKQNAGNTYIGSGSMSSDSYEMSQRAALLKDRLNFDIVPMHGGTKLQTRPSVANTYGGITRVGTSRKGYLENVEQALAKNIGGLSSHQLNQLSIYRQPIDPRVIQNMMIETRFANAINADVNKQLGINLPTATVNSSGYGIERPLLGFIPKQQKDGGVVKDNMGYWNPDNWGKVVEIDSNDITMQGVNQPLLGISDEGDIQYMEPGKDYKFKGKKVKEYPVGKRGISVNQADQNPTQKLDQLLNFTNYNKPTNGGWLDKYN